MFICPLVMVNGPSAGSVRLLFVKCAIAVSWSVKLPEIVSLLFESSLWILA